MFAGLALMFSGVACREKDPYAGKTVQDMDMALEILEYRERTPPLKGQAAPDPVVTDVATGKSHHLSSYWKKKPTVLIFGSLSCDRTCEGAPEISKLNSQFGNRYQFVFVYIREAHPSDGWKYGEKYPSVVDPTSTEIRQNVAVRLARKFELNFPIVIDETNDQAAVAFSAWPARLFVVDQQGLIQYRGDVGPWGYKPTIGFQTLDPIHEPSGKTSFVPNSENFFSLEAFLSNQPPID